MNVVFIGGPHAGAAISVADGVASIGPIGTGVYVRSGGLDAFGRVQFLWRENQVANAHTNAHTKTAALDSPPPLNPPLSWPYKIDPLPAGALFETAFANIAPRGAAEPDVTNPARKENF